MWALIKPKFSHLVALVIFIPLLLLALYVVTIHSSSYEEAERFVAQDARVAASIGPVKKTSFKFWNGFEFAGSDGSFSIEATTGKGTFIVDVRLRCMAGVWHVEAADIRSSSGTQTRLAIT